MVQLPTKAPSTYAEFKKGHFVVQKTEHAFSAMAMDQAHEQLNEQMKADKGYFWVNTLKFGIVALSLSIYI